jgi:hypothetical protein
MTWGAVAGAAIGAVGSYAASKGGSSSNGGAGTQTQSKEPWLQAQPWITSNLNRGQELQTAYQNQPFSALQNQAYQNQGNQSAYMRAAVPSLLGQISNQQVGFDRSNPNARPNAFSFDGLMSAAGAGQQAQQGQGLLSMLNSAPSGAANLNANTPQVAPKAAGDFVNYTETPGSKFYGAWINPESTRLLSDGGASMRAQFLQNQGGAGYGDFKYGMEIPQAGTKAYRDYMEYKAYGGADPYGLYTERAAPGWAREGGYGAATDDGGAAAAVGSSANF